MRDGAETVEAWIVLDSSRRNAQARRMDGKPWTRIGGKKAFTLPGSQAAWPIGATDIRDKPHVALCEGSPDFLSAWSLVGWHGRQHDLAPVFVAGSHAIHADALPRFASKCVFLVPHRDADGERARSTWTCQLLTAGAKWVRVLDVSPHKDLNEHIAAEMGKQFADAL